MWVMTKSFLKGKLISHLWSTTCQLIHEIYLKRKNNFFFSFVNNLNGHDPLLEGNSKYSIYY